VSELRPITQTCEPRDDVLKGGLADNHFAAQLDQVDDRRCELRVPGAADPGAQVELEDGERYHIRGRCRCVR
jgi:hypothetical protein